MIRVSVPVDEGLVHSTQCEAFALATPMRVDELIALAVAHASGPRAPEDKRRRALTTTLAQFAKGTFVVDIDGRTFSDPHTFVVCTGTVEMRFFSTISRRELRPSP